MHIQLNCLIICCAIFLLLPYASAEFAGVFGLLSHYIGLLGFHSNNTTTQYLTPSELGQSRGQTHYSYTNVALEPYQHSCVPDDKHIIHLVHLLRSKTKMSIRRPPLMVKCLQPELSDNATSYNGTASLIMLNNVKEILHLLNPIGNATKRHEPGNCVIVHFCTPTSLGCAAVAPVVNMLPHFFPTLRIAHIDAYRFGQLNAEFGIAGVPTLMIFHQARPIVKYYSDENTYNLFITRHTGIKPLKNPIGIDKISGPLPLTPTYQRDYYLLLAWVFVILCLMNHLRHTNFWKQIIEIIQRNWRESEETQMEMRDA